jgi:predicted nucleic acid-binding protein
MVELYGPMILVDTSVWIRALSQKAPYAAELDRLLARDEVSGHQLVYGELLIGDRGGRQKLLESYERIHQAPVIPHQDVVKFVRKRKLHGAGIGWIDAHLLASALVGNLKLWSLDSYVSALAREFKVAYEVPGAAQA